MELKVVEDNRLVLRALLASAVGKGYITRGIMKNSDKTPYWYFQKTEVKKDGS